MKKYFCFLFILTMASLPLSYSNEAAISESHHALDIAHTMRHFDKGNSLLLSRDYARALKELKKAELSLKNLMQPASDFPEVLEFLIVFSKTVAYDQLEMTTECEESLQKLLECMNDSEEDEEEDDQDCTEEDYLQSVKEQLSLMRNLASHARSLDVKITLDLIVEKMSQELLP